MAKRIFDVFVSFLCLILLAPLFLAVALWIKLDSQGPIFFKQIRIGKDFTPFTIYKFRTMIDRPSRGEIRLAVTQGDKITRVGRILRRTKIDEFPQLLNVVKGEMSLVGPRPEVHQYVELFRQDYEEILKVRPGITDLSSLKYWDEGEVLGKSGNPEETYVKYVLPEKIRVAKEYLKLRSFLFDMSLIVKTLIKLVS